MVTRKMIVLVLVLLLAVSGFAMAGSEEGEDMSVTVRRACGSCHTLKPVCRKVGTLTRANWKLTVRNMVARGAHVPTRNVEPMAEYLAGLEQGDPSVCK